MRKLSVYFTGTLFLAFLLTATAFKPADNRPSANGQGGLTLNNKVQHFSFRASTNAAGVVSGSFELKSPGDDLRVHGTIFCLIVAPDGKTATLRGNVTQRNGSGFPGFFNPGDFVVFKVQDNGEGANAAGDMFSDVVSPGNPNCVPTTLDLIPIENGNIQVKP